MKKIKIFYTDFWSGFDYKDNFIHHVLSKYYELEVCEDNPEYLFYSVFGRNHLRYECIRIFYTGENVRPNFAVCDYGIGFAHEAFGDRYVRYPHWCLYRDDLRRAMNPMLRPENNGGREAFCNFIYSNGKVLTPREAFFDRLSIYKKVDSGGRHRNNIGGAVADKFTWCSQYKFSITFENASTPGYTTEKILQAFAANTIPIYFGDPLVTKDFNGRAFVNCHDFAGVDDVISRIAELDKREDSYMDMLEETAIKAETVEEIDSAFEKFLLHIFEQDYEAAFRRNRTGCVAKKDRLVVYGAGKGYEELCGELGKRYDIIAVTSSDAMEKEKFHNYIENERLNEIGFDYILICNNYETESADKLLYERGITYDRILLRDMVFGNECGYWTLCDENAIMHVLLNAWNEKPEKIQNLTYMEWGTRHPIRGNYTWSLYLAGARGILAGVADDVRELVRIARPEDEILYREAADCFTEALVQVMDKTPDIWVVETEDAPEILAWTGWEKIRPVIVAVRLGMWGMCHTSWLEIERRFRGKGYILMTNNDGMGVFADAYVLRGGRNIVKRGR